MGFRIAYLHLTMAQCKGQGHVFFGSEYLGNGTDMKTLLFS